jgi:cysteinyl-tRNA synthetase, unknown class
VSERILRLAGGAALVLALSLGLGSAGAAEEEPNDFVYQLQRIDLEALGETRFDLVIMDYSRDGSDNKKFTAEEIGALKDSPGGPKTVLSYMSIGEAEDYRWYWQRSWDRNRDGRPDASAPAWLGRSNPDWPGNYKVRYWDPAWQQIVYDYVDKVLAAGYDGVFLDIVDAYEYWQPGGSSAPDYPDAEAEMVDFVKSIATYARVTQTHPNFRVIVQNAEELSRHPDYVQAVSGIGKEDLFYNGNRRQPADEVRWSVRQLDRFKEAGKPVLVTDYVTRRARIDAFYGKALLHGYVPYATRRDLDALTINRGHEPD